MKSTVCAPALVACAVLLTSFPRALAHGDDEDNTMDMGRPTIVNNNNMTNTNSTGEELATYFHLTEYSGLMFAHIVLMTVSWVFVLPIGVMLSIARSRYTLLLQFIFLVLNTLGVALVTVYNGSTPDLYPNNAHHKLGWILTWVMGAQTCMALISAYTGSWKKNGGERAAYVPVSTEAMAEHHRLHSLRLKTQYRYSNDSGHGTERNTESLRSHPSSPSEEHIDLHLPDVRQQYEQEEEPKTEQEQSFLGGGRVDRFMSKKIPNIFSERCLRILGIVYAVVDRVILILGFVAFTTGIVTYTGIFRGSSVFNGLAHFIKGGIFFWYGILTLGRWAGCFADLGWAWNIKPSADIVGKRKSSIPSAEFVESFLIFLYGSTNVFLEHLAGWGSAWSAQDLEHLSITIMFFGGGLCGMFIESKKIRELLNATLTSTAKPQFYSPYQHDSRDGDKSWAAPKSYAFSMNPLPGLIILLLGLMMSSHHQSSMVSSMVHKQWGTLLVGAAFARAVTYIIFYISPPTSLLPSRPPSEVITAFCLMAGGIIFMASSRDIVSSMEAYDVEAMFVFTVAMGVVAFFMAWVIFVIAIKGWAVRKEERLQPNFENLA